MNLSRLTRVVASLYLTFVVVGWIWNIWGVLLSPFVFFLLDKMLKPLASRFGNFSFHFRDTDWRQDGVKSTLHGLAIFLVALLVFIAWRTVTQGWAFHMDDTFVLWEQARTGRYTNWHPALYTLLFFSLPRMLWENINGAIVMHLVALSLGIAAVAFALLREGFSRRVVYVMSLITVCNPFVLIQSLKAYKDSAFAAFVMMSIACVIRIVYSRGKWIERPLNLCLTGVLMTIALIMRHNGFFYICPLAFMLLFCYIPMKRSLLLFLVVASVMALIYGPIYKCYLKIPKESHEAAHQHLLFESCGLPLSVMGAVYQAHCDDLPEENRKWLESIVAKDDWKNTFNGCFQSVKWEKYFSPRAPKWGMFWNDFKVLTMWDPQLSWRTFLRITSQAWNPFGSVDYSRCDELSDRVARRSLSAGWIMKKIFYVHFNCITGFVTLMLAILLGIFSGRKIGVVLVVPILCYNVGTMLLLTGNDARFFFYSVFAMPIVALLMLAGGNSDEMARQ